MRVLALHGLGGSPASLGDVPERLRATGHEVITPLLPGHGTSVTDLGDVSGDDWLAAVLAALGGGPTVLVGQSLGGVLALLAAADDARVVAVATVNAPVQPADPDATEHLEWLLGRGTTTLPTGPPDLADPEARDEAYDELPVRSLLELVRLSAAAHDVAPTVRVPVLVVTSDDDGVVDPATGDLLASLLPGAVTRLRLPRSKHVACLDLDRELLADELVRWLAGL